MDKRMYDKFTKRARSVLQRAAEEAALLYHPYIGTEHLLLGLLRERDSLAGRVLDDLGIKLESARHAVQFIVGEGDAAARNQEREFTQRAKRVLERAVEESRNLDHQYVGTEHLLLGLVRHGEGVAIGVLDIMGVQLEQVRASTLRIVRLATAGVVRNQAEPVVVEQTTTGVVIHLPPEAQPAPAPPRQQRRIPIAILGATGAVGQRLVMLLQNHPWFEIAALTGSERTVGQPYGELVRWVLDGAPPASVASMIVQPTEEVADVALALSALPTDAAKAYEPRWAERVAVCSNASSYRMTPDVPLLIPEVNPGHLDVIERQRAERGWRGCLVTNPNCASIGIVLALKPLHDTFGITKFHAATLQAVSGAGYPGVASLDILDNIVPNIADGGEEAKVETEPRKLLGTVRDGRFVHAEIGISAQVTRVPVTDGHTALLSVAFNQKPGVEEAIAALENFRAPEIVRGLPSAPERPIIVRPEGDRPQPRRDRDAGNGMSVVVGRVRPCPLHDLRLVALSHNTIRGAAGGALLNAELLVAAGVVS